MGLGGAKTPKYYNTNEFLLLIKQKTEEYRERASAHNIVTVSYIIIVIIIISLFTIWSIAGHNQG